MVILMFQRHPECVVTVMFAEFERFLMVILMFQRHPECVVTVMFAEV